MSVSIRPESPHLLPHLDRLLRRIEALESPLIQIWGWPGTGRTALLEAFLDRQGSSAIGLPLATFDNREMLRAAVEEAYEGGARWLVASGEPGERLAEAARWLRPSQRLVFAGGRRWSEASLPLAVIPPQEMLLSKEELASLWHLLTGLAPDSGILRGLCASGEGWYRPLRLAIDATGGPGLEDATPDLLLDFAPIRFFLRHEVLEVFSDDERKLLLSSPEDAWRVLEPWGYWVEGKEGDRPPRLLAAALDRERRRRTSRRGPTPAVPEVEPSEARPVYVLGLLGASVAKQRGPEGERDLDCRLRRSFQVLAYLASSPGLQAGREELIEAVWPTEGERTIERNFHPTLSHLRRALEGGRKGEGPSPLLFRSGVYRLNTEVTWEIDTIELTRLVEKGKELKTQEDLEGAAEAWRAAWKLY
ncbi:MAG: hypothetical protein ACLGI9_20900, partial [Thermoanaerobaculia bacterium]